MKKIGLVFSLILFFSFSFQVNAQWYQQNSGSTFPIYGVTFIDSSTGIAVGSKYTPNGNCGTVFKTTNGGTTWTQQVIEISVALHSVSFADTNIGTAVGYGGIIIHTTDGGTTWTQQASGTTEILMDVSFTDINTCTIVGYYGTILRTTDGRTTWVQQTSGTEIYLHGVSFKDANNGMAVGEGIILRTTNGGTTWIQQASGILFDVSFADYNNGTAIGATGLILRTTDGGLNWTQQTSGTTSQLWGVSFTDANNGTAVGAYGTILRTTDGGLNWTQQTSGTATNLWAVSFTDSDNGTVVGDGIILHTTNGGVTFIEDEEFNFTQPKEFSLAQNYPNPFNPSTKISWQSPVSGWKTLKVYDVLGNEVATLVNEYRPAGNYEVDFQSSVGSHQLANGVYIYRLQAGSFAETKKMILLK